MNERILNALMRLFAMLANTDEDSNSEDKIVENFLSKHLNTTQCQTYLAVYRGYAKKQKLYLVLDENDKGFSIDSERVILICNQINKELTRKQKFVLLLKLLELVASKHENSGQESILITTVAGCFHISDEELALCMDLSAKSTIEEISDSENFLIINSEKPGIFTAAKQLTSSQLQGTIVVMRVKNLRILFARYFGSSELYLNGHLIQPGKIYVISHGASLHSSKIQSIYYSDIIGCFFKDRVTDPIDFIATDISYKFKNGATGLHPLSLHAKSGNLIGIMGGSGAGKSTLLNLLNGNTAPTTGSIVINGYNLQSRKEELDGTIGFVPQDDLLIEELSVYQNLFYNAKLCFKDYTEAAITKMVVELLQSLGLQESMKLKVGTPLENIISGGQRKRLNIALELIREPSVLFLDEPTSGLSSRDSENIMDLLKGLTLKGKLVFVVIHQPSSDIFKMLDKLLMLDIGGYPTYYGDPLEAIVYFKTKVNHLNAGESECITCGNVNPEQIFNIIETKVLDDNGYPTEERRIAPQEWYESYKKNTKDERGLLSDAPNTNQRKINKKPSFLKQFQIFIARDVYSKISNTQYLVINFLQMPLLALILATLIKFYNKGEEYVFFDNRNLPAYLFMCVLVSLFVGLMTSAEEIIKDRKILKRESFLNLSRGGYLSSKISIMFFNSIIQTWSFVLIGNYILEIHAMNLSYWLVLFSTSCFANMLGLNISASFKSVVTIYILIPFLLIPQILLSGVLVKFQHLNPKISSQIMVPFEGDVMASRWAFEALAVNQFKNNLYEKDVYAYDKQRSLAEYKLYEWSNQMNNLTNEVLIEKSWPAGKVKEFDKLQTLKNEISKQNRITPQIKFRNIDTLTLAGYTIKTAEEIYEYLSQVNRYYVTAFNYADNKKDSVVRSQLDMGGDSKFNNAEFRLKHENENIANLVKNTSLLDQQKSIIEGDEIFALKDPIFISASKKHNIRSHFFAPEKYILGKYIDTFWVNIGVLWAMSLLLGVTLYVNALKRILDFFSSNKLALKVMTAMKR